MDIPKAKQFIFEGWQLQDDSRTVVFRYSYELADDTRQVYVETLTYPVNLTVDDSPKGTAIKNALDCVSIALGTSYYKMYFAPTITLETITLSKDQADFWNEIYTKGLGELFYKNKIDFRGLVNFPSGKIETKQPDRLELKKNTALLGWGGGKDSIAAYELLKAKGYSSTLFSMRTSVIQQETANITGEEYLVVERVLDQGMIEASKAGTVYAGHVPITNINSWVAVVLALQLDISEVVFANEKSADYGNVEYLGMMVNHQWSKSSEPIKMTQSYIAKYISSDLKYYSIFSDVWEIDIVEEFVKHPHYFKAFSSCNRNFTLVKTGEEKHWCGECAKCCFVFTLMAAFLDKKTVTDIFSKDLFDDESLIPLFQQLLGYEIKPFDCVGTPEEVEEALGKIIAKAEFDTSAIIQKYKKDKLKKGI